MEARTQQIPIEEIKIPDGQRELGNLEGLIDPIQMLGLLEPVLVIPEGAHYRVIDSQRRYHACKRLGWSAIPAIVLSVDDQVAELIAIDVHLMREELTPSERDDLRQQRKESVTTIQRQHKNRNSPGQAQRKEEQKEGSSPVANIPSRIESTPRTLLQLIGRLFCI